MQRVREAAFAPVFRSSAAAVGEEAASIASARRADADQARLLEGLCGAGSGHEALAATAERGAVAAFASFAADAETRMGGIGPDAVHAGRAA